MALVSRTTDPAVQSAVANAAARVEAKGASWGEAKRRTFELLVAAGRPVKAYDLIAAYAPGRPPQPPTIYRAIQFLLDHGLVHRIACQNAFVACTLGAIAHESGFLICSSCGATEETVLDSDAFANAAARVGFQVHQLISEIRGICPACSGAGLRGGLPEG
ncbi:MAG: transcriptional repressor [Phenylobacterium sp.]|uniref:Fur family transcriptional regulator n=1 Tax=Phenylobacterium sp. TaxID=1871053 RepID=UPI001A602052|nr:transcriptional repressor [Phenylobacterium sp.]MBL8772236.1 transcriptional repressor [Phenylobacterium sp.]